MKWWALIFVGALSGCMSTNEISFDVLDTAPSEGELRHPEWGDPVETNRGRGEHMSAMPMSQPMTHAAPMMQKMASGEYTPPDLRGVSLEPSVASVHAFLDQHRIQHEFVTDDYKMIRLKELVRFNTGSAKLSQKSRNWINQLARFLVTRVDVDIVIEGHADSRGEATFNEKLSDRRAKSVEKQFLANNLPSKRVYTRGFGEYMPKCDNDTSKGLACNRRVELTLIVGQ